MDSHQDCCYNLLGFNGRDLMKVKKGTLISTSSLLVVARRFCVMWLIVYSHSRSALPSCWTCIGHSLLLQLTKELQPQSDLDWLILKREPRVPACFLLWMLHASESTSHMKLILPWVLTSLHCGKFVLEAKLSHLIKVPPSPHPLQWLLKSDY